MELYSFPGMFSRFLVSLILFKYEPLYSQFTLINLCSGSLSAPKRKPCITPCHMGGSG